MLRNIGSKSGLQQKKWEPYRAIWFSELRNILRRIVSDRKNRLPSSGGGVSKATAYRYLVAMDERGMLEYDGSSRTIVTKLLEETEGWMECDQCGNVCESQGLFFLVR